LQVTIALNRKWYNWREWGNRSTAIPAVSLISFGKETVLIYEYICNFSQSSRLVIALLGLMNTKENEEENVSVQIKFRIEFFEPIVII